MDSPLVKYTVSNSVFPVSRMFVLDRGTTHMPTHGCAPLVLLRFNLGVNCTHGLARPGPLVFCSIE